jgi:hypothetical protein
VLEEHGFDELLEHGAFVKVVGGFEGEAQVVCGAALRATITYRIVSMTSPQAYSGGRPHGPGPRTGRALFTHPVQL